MKLVRADIRTPFPAPCATVCASCAAQAAGREARHGEVRHRDRARGPDDPNANGAPTGPPPPPPVREVRLSNGAEFVVAICGEVMTMPGSPKVPAANTIGLNAHGQIEGLL